MSGDSAAITKEIHVAAGVLWRGGRVLCCRRPEGRPMAGFWEFPGGKLEPGETPEDALCRELFEELGVRVTALVFWRRLDHDYAERGLRVHLYFFHVTAFAGEPAAKEGQGLVWQPWERAWELDFLGADADIVRELAPPAPEGQAGA